SISLSNVKQSRIEIIKLLSMINFKSFLPKLVIIGAPNVGKSTLLNILTKGKKSKIEDRPGVTKKNDWFSFDKKFWILDTPGILQPKFINENQGVALAAIGSIKLDILPLEIVAISLVKKLMFLKKIEGNDPELYVNNLIIKLKKQPNEVYRKIIKDYQSQKFGKIILD
ncbi:MAG: 50S ribosome-binding GTPase, partial [Mycoplasmataceae bacterium]|nr:50S ribosome-binding GTPase [Mycoplasmataceae bacterium]